jgi:hypothetical protein
VTAHLASPSYASNVPPVDWSEHRQPNMVLPMSRRTALWLLLIEVTVIVMVIAIFGNPRSSLASALALSLALGGLPAGGAAYAIRRRKPPFRFGLPATAIIVTVIWAVCAFCLFIRTYQGY